MNRTNTSSCDQDFVLPDPIVRYCYVCISGLIVSFSSVSFFIMIKAPKLNLNIKYLSNNILLYDNLLLICFILENVYIDDSSWFFFRVNNLCIHSGLLAVTGFSVERFAALAFPYKYSVYFKHVSVKTFVWLQLSAFSITIVYISFTDWKCQTADKFCLIGVVYHSSLNVTCLICNLKSVFILKRHISQVHTLTRSVSNKTIPFSYKNVALSVACLLYCLLHMPLDIEVFIRKCYRPPLARMYTYHILIFNSAINPLVYVWRFRECRLQSLIYLSKLPVCRFLERTVLERRMDIFDIPTVRRMWFKLKVVYFSHSGRNWEQLTACISWTIWILVADWYFYLVAQFFCSKCMSMLYINMLYLKYDWIIIS